MLRDLSGAALVVASLVVLYLAITNLGSHDYVAAIVLTVMGLALLGGGVELLRPTVGE